MSLVVKMSEIVTGSLVGLHIPVNSYLGIEEFYDGV